MKSLVIIGARGHGRMWRSLWAHGVQVFLDRDPALHGQSVDAVLVQGGHDLLDDYPTHPIALGIGTNSERKRVYEELIARGFLIVDFRHPDAMVNVGAQIGKNIILNTGCIIEHDCVIGDHAHICPGAVLCGGVLVGEGAVIGANATIKDGIEIGRWATVGCGAVVVDDVPDGLTVVGNPAHYIHKREFDTNGFVVLRDFFDAQPIEWALNAFLPSVTATLKGRAISYANGQINSVHGINHELFHKVIYSDPMLAVASGLLGEEAVPRAVECFAKPAHVGLASPPHQDNAYWCLEPAIGLTIWLSLDQSDEQNGGLSFFKGSHQCGLLPHRPSYAPGSSQTVETVVAAEVVTPTLQPGDATAHHCLTVHGSHQNTSARPRRAVTLQYQGVSARVNEAKKRAYEASLEEQVRGRA
jgi:phytanoyl-CoA hydroxylase